MENGDQFILYEDLTEQRRLEDQFRQAQKMEAVGTLAGGIAHDFNNLLMGIQGRISLLLLEEEPSSNVFTELKKVEEYVKSAARLTRQLLGFARGGKYEAKPTDLNAVVARSSEMFGRAKKEIVIHAKYQEALWSVEADVGQIEQVLLNLYVNAWQAMPAGGELYLQTENTVLDDAYSQPYDFTPGRYVKISVTDTGIGMTREVRERIFEPFFTTKEKGRGTGLGLASAYGIVKNHGGIINVYSEPGQGSTFTVYLPASEASTTTEPGAPEGIRKGQERILLVDDEEMILAVGRKMLESIGYRVTTAAEGKEAVRLFREGKERIDLVILDMIMPGMGGKETFEQLRSIDPGVNVLLSSGYSLNGSAQEILSKGCRGFIQKPFTLAELSAKVRSILDPDADRIPA